MAIIHNRHALARTLVGNVFPWGDYLCSDIVLIFKSRLLHNGSIGGDYSDVGSPSNPLSIAVQQLGGRTLAMN